MPVPRPLTVREKISLTLRRRRRTSGFWYGLAITLIWPFILFGNRVGFRGGEHIPRTGGAILAINHISSSDPVFDVAFTIAHGRMPRFLAKAELWKIPVVRSVLGRGGHIPVDRASSRAAKAYTGAVEAIKRGEVVAFYPEGTYTADPAGWPMDPKNGIGRLALLTGAPVIPVANWGTREFLPPSTARPRFSFRTQISVVAGPPVDLSAWLGGPRTRTALDGATAAIMADVVGLLADVRGEQPPSLAAGVESAGTAVGAESAGVASAVESAGVASAVESAGAMSAVESAGAAVGVESAGAAVAAESGGATSGGESAAVAVAAESGGASGGASVGAGAAGRVGAESGDVTPAEPVGQPSDEEPRSA